MIDLESIANRITTALYNETDLSEVEKAKIEYGLSLTLGITITLAIALILAIILRAVPQTLIVFGAAMSLRVFYGGAHCSSYDRCLVLSLVVFISAAVLVKYLIGILSVEILTGVYAGLVLFVLTYLLIRNVKLVVIILLANGITAGLSCLIKGSVAQWPMFAVAVGHFIQVAMSTGPGLWLVGIFDGAKKSVED